MKLLRSAVLIFITVVTLNLHAATNTATGYYNMAMAELGYNNLPSAIELMNKAIELRPDYADAIANRGYFFYLSKQYDKAIVDYVVAEKLKKYSVGYLMACPYALTGKKDEAFKCLEEALKAPEDKVDINAIINESGLSDLKSDPRWNAMINKEWYSPYEKLIFEGNKKMGEKNLSGALETWAKAIALQPAKDVAYGSRALTYINQGNLEKALTDLTEAIRLKPTSSTYHGNRAYVYKELKKRTEAMADYNKAIELDPQNMVYADRAMMKFGIDQKDPSIETDLKAHLDGYYKDDFNHYLLATYYDRNGRMSDAVTYFTKAIAVNNTTSDYFVARGHSNFSLKQHAAAIDDFTSAIKLSPARGDAYYARGVVKGELRDKDAACIDWRKAESLGQKDVEGYIKSICK